MRIRNRLLAAAFAMSLQTAVGALFGVEGEALAQPEPPFAICRQPYALCATATCFVYNEVAYCECDIERGRNISLQLDYTTATGTTRNVCDVETAGLANGYLVSTYSVPDTSRGASYTCPGPANADGGVTAPVAYAQCDGGLCFRSSVGERFPGFDKRLARDEIICSCPISTAGTEGSTNARGYEIFGPYAPNAPSGQKCDPQACALCSVPSPMANGAIIKVGGPTGIAKELALRLDGPPAPDFNECPCTCTTATDGTTSCTLAADAP